MKTSEAEKLEDKLVSIQRVVVAVDLTKHSEATAHYAAEIARCFDATLYVAHVFASEPFYELGSEGAYNLIDQRRHELQAQLDDLKEQVQKLVPVCESVFLEGEAAEQITALARDVDADLIVTASHHPTFLGRLFNLDKAPQIMHRAPCPVLVYHEKSP
jgi:nucleotide-binding universal stress UspA family protein